MGRPDRRWWSAALLAALLGGTAAPAAAEPLVRIDGGTGVPGGSAAAMLSLADDPTGRVVSGLVAVDFPDPPLRAGADDCAIAERLAGTHRLLTSAPQPGRLQLSLAPRAGTPPLGDGDLARCTFAIALGAPAGTAALRLDVALTDAAGEPVPASATDGSIVIDAPRPTATVTSTPTVTPPTTVSRTPTLTPVPIPTDTPTTTPTPTRFVPVVIADNLDGCAVAPPGGAAAWPLLAAAWLLVRPRRR